LRLPFRHVRGANLKSRSARRPFSIGRACSGSEHDNLAAPCYCCLFLAGAVGRILPHGSADEFLSGIFFIAAL